MTDDAKAKAKVFLFCNARSCAGTEFGAGHDWHDVYAIAENGVCVGGHICSHHSFMEGDLVTNRPERKVRLDEMFPQGWDLKYVSDPMNDAELEAAWALNQELAESEDGAVADVDSEVAP